MNNFHLKNKIVYVPVILSILISACSGEGIQDKKSNEKIGSTEQQLSGNVLGEIQVDGPPTGADLFADTGTPLNVGASSDWVADLTSNSGTGCLGVDGNATCIEPGVTGATGGVGHWNGVRIVDGLGSGDQNIFLTGGKENDASTWNIGAGSVGSSKYDISQAYLASNQNSVYFGMERSGNNGTTAFDFEFNQLQPMSLPSCPQIVDVPCRSVGDVLFTFEMQGSGNSGTATPHRYTWNGSTYVEGVANGILSSINNSLVTAGAPWGHVDSHGHWVLGNMERFTFAEAVAPISLLPGSNGCGGQSYVQVRTRSSAVATSDLKDTTHYFQFVYNSISAIATLTSSCDGSLAFSVYGNTSNGDPLVNPTCAWTFSNGTVSDQCVGSLLQLAPGSYSATVQVADPAMPNCGTTAGAAQVEVLEGLSVHLTLDGSAQSCPGMSNDSVTYNAVVVGGNENYSYEWTGVSCSGISCTIDPDNSLLCTQQSLSVKVSDTSGLCDPAVSELETYSKVTVVSASDN